MVKKLDAIKLYEIEEFGNIAQSQTAYITSLHLSDTFSKKHVIVNLTHKRVRHLT